MLLQAMKNMLMKQMIITGSPEESQKSEKKSDSMNSYLMMKVAHRTTAYWGRGKGVFE